MSTRRYQNRRRHRSPYRRFLDVEATVIGRVIDEAPQTALRLLPGEPLVTSASFATSVVTPEERSAVKNLVEQNFDAWLYFENTGPRQVGFRIPSRMLSAETIAPYVVGGFHEGVQVETDAEDLILRLMFYSEDAEGFNLNRDGLGWLDFIAPVRRELMSGRLDVLELGPRFGTFWDLIEGEPDLPADYGLSKASRILAAYLLVGPDDLDRWQMGRAEEFFSNLSETVQDITPVARWEFVAADPEKSFQITLGKFPNGSSYGTWYIVATDPHCDELVCETESEARSYYHDEALRLQRLNDPGRWRPIISEES
ncbi:hypothetical protein ACIBMZ_30590 [Micromonospora sp. NPDC049900]|uniref:hypothetical protein n=1 Tax=Micromonospora sp. NPDC049900 TaxID=3364275 RepID=UPI0037935B4C